MQTVTASDFKATCLRLVDKICQTGEQIVITNKRFAAEMSWLPL